MTVSTQLDVRIGHPGPSFLGLDAGERNREVARRAATQDPALAGTLHVPDDSVVVTPALFEWLPREGSWQIDWQSDRHPLVWEAASGSRAVGRATAPHGAVLDVQTPQARRQAAWTLLRRSGKPTDGWLSRHVHRKVSRVLSYMLLGLGLRANDATFLTIGIGALSAGFIAQTSHVTMIVGWFLFWFASVADGVDGEMARMTLSESALGEQLDTFADAFTYVLCFAATMIGWVRQGIGRDGLILGTIVAVALPSTFLWGMHIVRRAAGSSVFFVETKPIELALKDAAETTGASTLRLASTIFVLFRREAFSLALFVGSFLTAWRGLVPAGIAGGLLVVLATFAAYHRELDRALRARLAPSAFTLS